MAGTTTTGATDAAKARPTARRRPRRVRSCIVSARCTPEWRDWLARLAEHLRKTDVDAIDEALVRLARAESFELPPRR